MKNLRMLLLGGTLLLGAAPLAAQNSVDVLGGGPQPANTIGCVSPPGNPNCIPATWSTTSYGLSAWNERANLPGRYP